MQRQTEDWFQYVLWCDRSCRLSEANDGPEYADLRRQAYRTIGTWNSTADDAKVFTNPADLAAVRMALSVITGQEILLIMEPSRIIISMYLRVLIKQKYFSHMDFSGKKDC